MPPRVHHCHHQASPVVADAVADADVDAGADVTAVASFKFVVAINHRHFTWICWLGVVYVRAFSVLGICFRSFDFVAPRLR